MAAKQKITVKRVRTRTRTWRPSSSKGSGTKQRRCPTCGKFR